MKYLRRVIVALAILLSAFCMYYSINRLLTDPVTSEIVSSNSEENSDAAEEEMKAYTYFRETEPANSFSARKISQYGEDAELVCNAAGYNDIYTARAESVIPVTDAIKDNHIWRKERGSTLHIEGSPTETQDCFLKTGGVTALVPAVRLSSGDVLTIAVNKSGETTGEEYYPVSVYLGVLYSDNTDDEFEINLTNRNGLTKKDIKLEKDVTELTFYMTIKGNVAYDTDISWLAVKNTTISKAAIPEDSVIIFAADELGDNGFSIFPAKGVIRYTTDVNEYRLQEDDYMEEHRSYATPEQYGAVGDGITDDTQALQECIDRANENKIPIRGFRTYKISKMLSIKGDENNIYFHILKYDGSEMAVDLSGKYNYIRIDYIDAYDSNGGAFRLSTTNELDAMYNEIHLGEVNAYANAVEYVNELGNGLRGLYYNRLSAQRLYSKAFNCVYIGATNSQCGENSFYGKHVSNENGYVVYCEGYGNNDTNRFYEFCIEDSSQNGVYGIATLINCRTIECMDTRRPDNDEGYIVTYNGVLPIGRFINTQVDYASVNISQAMTYEDCLETIKNSYEDGSTKALAYLDGFPSESKDYVVGETNRLWDYYAVSDPERGYNTPNGRIIAYFDHKGFVPDTDWYHEINTSDYRTIETDAVTPTIFDIAANTVIHLDDSYCPVGIKEFRVVQYKAKKARVYDHNDRLIFDGRKLAEGTYVVRCYITEHEFDVETQKGTLHYDGNLTRGYYYGFNEAWTVEKLNIISQTE